MYHPGRTHQNPSSQDLQEQRLLPFITRKFSLGLLWFLLLVSLLFQIGKGTQEARRQARTMDMGSPCISPQQQSRGQHASWMHNKCYFIVTVMFGLINPHTLRKSTAQGLCLTLMPQSSWTLLFFCKDVMHFLKSDFTFLTQKVKKIFIVALFLFVWVLVYIFFQGMWRRRQHHQKNTSHTFQVLHKCSLKDYCETAKI